MPRYRREILADRRGLRRPERAAAPAAVMLSEAKHLASLRQSAGFFVAALLRMTGGATAAARYRRARRAKAALEDPKAAFGRNRTRARRRPSC